MKNVSISSNHAIINLNSKLYTTSSIQKTSRDFSGICTIGIKPTEDRTIITLDSRASENMEKICHEFLNHLIANMKSV